MAAESYPLMNQHTSPSWTPLAVAALLAVSAGVCVGLVFHTTVATPSLYAATATTQVQPGQVLMRAPHAFRPEMGRAPTAQVSVEAMPYGAGSMETAKMGLQGGLQATTTAPMAIGMFALVGAIAGYAVRAFSSQTAPESRVAMMATAGTPSYKLRYFDAKGVVELSRFMFAIAGVEYEDYRYKFTFGTPGDFRTISKPEFDADKASGVLDPNMGRLPILEVDGVPIGQSKSIERYLARQFGFMGANDVEAAQVDTLCEHVRDIKDKYQKVKATAGEEKKAAALKEWYADELPQWCSNLENCLGSSGWSVGTKFSLADLSVWALLTDSFDDKEAAAAAYGACPKVKAVCDGVSAMPGVQGWIEKRPFNPF